MAITHSTFVRNALANTVRDLIDGAGNGTLKLCTADMTVLITFTLASPSFGPASGGLMTANPIGSEICVTGGGLAAKFTINDANDNLVLTGNVGTSGSDINISDLNIANNDQVSITSLTYRAPA